MYQISDPSAGQRRLGTGLTIRDIKDVDILDAFITQSDFFLHVDLERGIVAETAKVSGRAGHDGELFMRSSESSQIRDAFLQFQVCWVDPDGNELFGSFSRDYYQQWYGSDVPSRATLVKSFMFSSQTAKTPDASDMTCSNLS